MTHCVMLLALLLAQGIPNQVVSPVGRPTTSAINIQVDPAHPVPVSATVNVSGAADLAGNTATFNANNICTSVITAGEQSVGFHLTAGTLDATLTAYITNQIGAVNCATAGTCSTVAFSSGSTIVVTNPNGVKDVGINVVSTRQVQVCTTTYASGSATGVVTATYLQAASAGGGGGGVVTQGTSPWVVSAASLPLPTGAAKETGGNLDSLVAKDFATQSTLALIKAKTDNLDVLLSTRTKPADTQPISAASLPLPTGAATDRTTSAGPFSVRISTGAAFIDPTQIRALTVADVVTVAQGAAGASAWLVTGTGGTFPVTGTFWQATQPVSGPLTDTQLRAVAVPVSGTFWQATQPISGTVTTSPPANASTNVAQINGVAPLMGAGNTGTGSPRVTIASDQAAFGVKNDLSDFSSTSSGLSTATTLTQLVAASGSNKVYVLNWKCSSSVAATTTTDQQCTLKYGTGSNCGTGTTYADGCFNPANGGCVGGQLVIPASQALCWIHAAAGSKIITITYKQLP